jgi:uncharacterized membrane protein (DUF4010 family)
VGLEDVLTGGVDFEFLLRMGIGLAVGALIGLERERHREQRTVLAGIRTYPLAALAGVVFAQLGLHLEDHFYVAVGALIFGAISLLLYWVRHKLGVHGLTSPIAFFVTYLAGALIGLGFLLEGIVAGVATAVLLFTRARLHRLAEVMTEKEMAGALQFIIVAFILFPLMPEDPIDPWNLLDLRNLLLIVILVSVLSFIGFLAMRFLGASHGLAVSGLLGGLANSEATTASLANLARERTDLTKNAMEGISLANATMLVRNLVFAAIVDPSLRFLLLVLPALAVMFLAQTGFTALRERHRGDVAQEPSAIRIENPFAFGPALRFAGIFLLIHATVTIILRYQIGGEAAVLLTAIGGLVSSAAVVISVGSSYAAGDLSLEIAVAAAVLASLVSTLNKLVLVRIVHQPLVRLLMPRIFVTVALGGLALVLTHILL